MKYALRERKKAKLKIGLVNALIEEIKTRRFEEIKVKDLCYQMDISEVTFFNYFQQKEAMLQYYMAIWNYNREIHIQKIGRKKGLAAIHSLFDDIAATDNAVAIMNTLTTYIAKLTEKPGPVSLSECEMWLLSGEESPPPELDMNQQIIMHLEEAITGKELDPGINISEYHLLLSSLFYGGSIIAHAARTPLEQVYKNSLSIIFNR